MPKIYAVHYGPGNPSMTYEGIRDSGTDAIVGLLNLEGHRFFSTEAKAEEAILKKLGHDATVEKNAGNAIVEVKKIGYVEEDKTVDRWTLLIGEEEDDLDAISVAYVIEIELDQDEYPTT